MATSDGELSAELLPRKELANRTATYERSLATTALRWAIWLSMCVALGIYLAFYVAWPVNSLERIRTVLLFATVEKIGLNGGWSTLCSACECVDFKFFLFVGLN